MPVVTTVLIVVSVIVLIMLVVILVAQVKSNRHIETLKKSVDMSKRAEKSPAPKTMRGAKPSERAPKPSAEVGISAVQEVKEPEAEPVPEPLVPEEAVVEETVSAEPEPIAVEIPEPGVAEAVPEPVEVPAAEPEVVEEALEEVPAEIAEELPAAEEKVPAEEAPAAFEPKPYPEFNNARAVEQLGLSQEEADMFIGELVTQIEEEIPNLDAALAANDVEKLEKVSHMLKGSATSLGEGGVADVLVDFNTYCKSGSDRAVLETHINNLRYYFEKLKAKFAA